MNREKILAGLDAGHINTKAVIMKGREILGFSILPSGFDAAAAARTALEEALKIAGISSDEPEGFLATGIFRDVIEVPSMKVLGSVPEYVAGAKGALFLNRNSRTLIDIGGNIHKAVCYDTNGDLLDVTQNDKCADGLGIFYTTMARAMGLTEQELSESAIGSEGSPSIAIQCALSAESDAIDLLCQGRDMADVADAVLRFIAERVADMCTYMSLKKEIVVAGGLARSGTLIRHLSNLIKQEVSLLNHPEYAVAIGAVISHEEVK